MFDSGGDCATVPIASQGPGRAAAADMPALELARAERVASRALQPDDLAWLQDGFNAFLASGGKLPLERCLHLPTNERTLSRARRDHWLRQAWLALSDETSTWRRSERLAAEVQRFDSFRWRRWASLPEPPAGCSALERALFHAFRSHDRVPGTAMQLHNIAAQCRGRPAQ